MSGSNFYCELCKITCNSDLAFRQHQEGRSHMKNVAESERKQQQQSASQPHDPLQYLQYLEHLKHLEHLRNLSSLQQQPNPQQLSEQPPQQSLQHPQQSLQHPQQSLQHPQQSLQHPQQSLQHPQQSLQHPQQSLQHPQQNLQHLQQEQLQQNFCQICNCNVPDGPINWQIHLNGQQHAKALSNEPQKQTQFTCDVCNKKVSGKENFEIHLASQRHKKKLAERQSGNAPSTDLSSSAAAVEVSVTNKNSNRADPYIVIKDATKSQYHCQLCDKLLSGEKAVEEHCSGKNHRLKIQSQVSPPPPAAASVSASSQAQAQLHHILAPQLQQLLSELSKAAQSGWLSLDRLSSEALAHQALTPRDVSRCSSVEQLLVRLAAANRLDVAARELPSPGQNLAAQCVERAEKIVAMLMAGDGF